MSPPTAPFITCSFNTSSRFRVALAMLLCSSVLASGKTGTLRALASAANTEQFDGPAPMLQDEVEQKIEDRPALTKLPDATIELARFFDRDVDFRYDEKTGALIVESKLTLDRLAEAPSIPAEKLEAGLLDDQSFVAQFMKTELEGSLPDHLAFSTKPKFVKDDNATVVIAEGNDIPAAVFGVDTRQTFHDYHYPFSTVGKVQTGDGGYCTGTMVGRRLMLTAAHCVHWTSENQAGWLKFTPSYYDDESPPFGSAWATNIFFWEKLNAKAGLSDQDTAFDYVIAVLDRNMGDLTGYTGYRTYNPSWNNRTVWQNIGYPGGIKFGERPVISSGGAITSVESKTGTTSGQTGYVLGNFIDMGGGQSGGPVWGWWAGETYPRIIGGMSAESATPGPTTLGDNEAAGGPALSALIGWARNKFP